MKKIFESASKLVFIMLMGTACLAFLFEVGKGVVILEAKDFMVLASGAAAFYFSYKGSGNEPTPAKPGEAGARPHAGK